MDEMVEVKMNVKIDPEWIDYLIKAPDIFMTNHCGYWMYGMDQDDELGWLCYVHNDEKSLLDVKNDPELPGIVKAWKEGKELPENWYRLDKDRAKQAWAEGVRRNGKDWYEEADALDYDVVIQLAFFGEIVYG